MTPAAAVRERPIIFSGPLVRAILAGTKTVTRRVVRPQPGDDPRDDGYLSSMLARCPFGVPGDRLWVRETFWITHDSDWSESLGRSLDCGARLHDPESRVQYVATPNNSERPAEPGDWCGPDDTFFEERTWVAWGDGAWLSPFYSKKPAIHMPRWASRLLLEVTSVRVERLQEITEEDARAEGVALESLSGISDEQRIAADSRGRTKRSDPHALAFAMTWDALHAKRPGAAWADNPWVWVVGFKRIEEAAR